MLTQEQERLLTEQPLNEIALIESFMPLAKYIARKYSANQDVVDDYVSLGYIAIIEAVRNLAVDRNPEAYIATKIHSYIRAERRRRQSFTTIIARRKTRRIREICEADLSYQHTVEEAVKGCKITYKERPVFDLMVYGAKSPAISETLNIPRSSTQAIMLRIKRKVKKYYAPAFRCTRSKRSNNASERQASCP